MGGDSLPKVGILIFSGPRSHPREPISVKFRVTKRTHVSLGHAKCHMNRCNESLLRGENCDFWLVSAGNETQKSKII